MKRFLIIMALCLAASICITGCFTPVAPAPMPTITTESTADDNTNDDPPAPPPPLHSDLYIEGLAVEDVIRYFNEVCLDAEFVTGSGNASLVQKWSIPIIYQLNGTHTDDDLQVLKSFCDTLNAIEGFPGIRQADAQNTANTQIHFCSADALVDIMGSNYAGCDGAVTYWYYTDSNAIYTSTIAIRNDMSQYTRNSVIQEEIYNGLGATQDTDLREDSLIYSGFSEPQEMTEIDELILKLLYHPEIKCGMNIEECEAVIRQLYY